MAIWARTPERIAAWIAAGNEPPDAGHIHRYLEGHGIVVNGVSVRRDGNLVIDSDATVQKLRPALDAIEPETLDPAKGTRAAATATLRSALAEIRGRPAPERTAADTAVLSLAALLGLDDAPIAAAGNAR